MKIYHKLLPLATGYFGVSSALYSYGGLVVVYGPAGGAWHINIEDEPRWYRGPATVVGAGLLEMDVILGNENKFIDNIAEVATQLERQFIVLAGTPISEIIGTDLKGFSRMLETRTGLPVFMVPTAGSEPYPEGAGKALVALAQKFMGQPQEKTKNSINVVGAVHLSTGREERLTPLFDAIEQAGFSLNSVLSPFRQEDDPLDAVRKAPDAEVNLVISSSGVALADYMYAQYGIPYVVGMPVGRQGWNELSALLRTNPVSYAPTPEQKTLFSHALVIGEPVMSYGIQRCLRADFGIGRVDVVSVTPDEPLFKPAEGRVAVFAERGGQDSCTDGEQEIADLMNDPSVDCIVADPCYEPLLEQPKKFISLPHMAMSARFHWDQPYDYAVDKGYTYFAGQLFAGE